MARQWKETDFANRPLFAYPLPRGREDVVGSLMTYTIEQGDTLLDVGRWYGVTAKEISDANGGIDWWKPPVGRSPAVRGRDAARRRRTRRSRT